MATNPINTTRKQRALAPRKEPYWHAIRRGAALGLYVGTTKREWTARALGPDKRYRFSTLGDLEAVTYEEAEARARAFADTAARTERPDYRVRDAVEDYVGHLRKENSQRAADDALGRLTKHVLPAFGDVKLTDLRSRDLTRWLHSLVPESEDPQEVRRAKSTANRVLNSFKAGLNLAFYSGTAPADGEWRRVKGFENADTSRTLFLTPDQAKDLLSATSGAFRDLVKAAVLTGARYGELANAKAGDFDAKGGTLHLDGKTGSRTCYLSGDAVTFFRSLTKDSLSGALLLTKDDGTAWAKSHQQRPMIAAVDAAGLPPETVFYSLRHYHISRALLAGMPAQVIAENCGTSVRMIEKHYGHFACADRRAMMDSVLL